VIALAAAVVIMTSTSSGAAAVSPTPTPPPKTDAEYWRQERVREQPQASPAPSPSAISEPLATPTPDAPVNFFSVGGGMAFLSKKGWGSVREQPSVAVRADIKILDGLELSGIVGASHKEATASGTDVTATTYNGRLGLLAASRDGNAIFFVAAGAAGTQANVSSDGLGGAGNETTNLFGGYAGGGLATTIQQKTLVGVEVDYLEERHRGVEVGGVHAMLYLSFGQD
jgi:hypothetical protein